MPLVLVRITADYSAKRLAEQQSFIHRYLFINVGRARIGSVVSFILVVGFDLDKARLSRPPFGSKTWPPRSSRFWTNQSGNLIQLAPSVISYYLTTLLLICRNVSRPTEGCACYAKVATRKVHRVTTLARQCSPSTRWPERSDHNKKATPKRGRF